MLIVSNVITCTFTIVLGFLFVRNHHKQKHRSLQQVCCECLPSNAPSTSEVEPCLPGFFGDSKTDAGCIPDSLVEDDADFAGTPDLFDLCPGQDDNTCDETDVELGMPAYNYFVDPETLIVESPFKNLITRSLLRATLSIDKNAVSKMELVAQTADGSDYVMFTIEQEEDEGENRNIELAQRQLLSKPWYCCEQWYPGCVDKIHECTRSMLCSYTFSSTICLPAIPSFIFKVGCGFLAGSLIKDSGLCDGKFLFH